MNMEQWGNKPDGGKTKILVQNLHKVHFSTTNPSEFGLGLNPGLRG